MPFDNFEIGLLSENTALNIEQYAENSLEDNSRYILKVTPTDKVRFSFLCYTEPVEILEIYKGDDLQIGEEIEIFRNSSTIFWDLNDTDCANMGFVNLMNESEEYLVFLDKKIEDKPVYKTTYCVVAPIFSYTHHDNLVVNGKNNSSSIEYINVKNNEFFVGDDYSLNALERAKEKFILKYT